MQIVAGSAPENLSELQLNIPCERVSVSLKNQFIFFFYI